jgi:uncharacterized protein YjiS (DUF1127 family)
MIAIQTRAFLVASGLRGQASQFGFWLRRCWQRARSRRALAELSDWHLADIGLTRDQVEEDLDRPPWR